MVDDPVVSDSLEGSVARDRPVDTARLSVVIPTYGGGVRLATTLSAVMSSETTALDGVEVIVVDDGSPEPVAPVLAEYLGAAPIPLTIIRQENAGPAAARNRGFRAARGEIVLFLDDDVEIPPDLIAGHAAAHRHWPNSVVWGRCVLPPGSSVMRDTLERLGGDWTDVTEEYRRVSSLASGHLSVERDTFAARGSVYAEELRTPAAEEYELAHRVRQEGIRVVFASRLVALHHQSLEIDAVCRAQYKHGVGCAEAAAKYPQTLESTDLASKIERCASPSTTPRGLAKYLMSSGPVRQGLLTAATILSSFGAPALFLGPLYRAAIAAHFVGGVRDGSRRYPLRRPGSLPTGGRISLAGNGIYTLRAYLASLAVRARPAPGELDANDVRKVLLVCTGLVGDSLMSLPAMSCARTLLPRAEVVALVTERVQGLLELSRGSFDRFIVATGAPLSLRPRRRRENASLQARLAEEGFDVAVVFLGDDYAPMLTRAGIPWRVFVEESPYRRLATQRYRIGHPRTWGPLERFGAWRALGLEPRLGSATLMPPASALHAVNVRLGRFLRPIVVIHPFGRTPEQWWPESAWIALASMVRRELGGTAILVGDAQGSAPAPGTADIEVMGLLSMSELAALFVKADCIVSTDSGPFHLAGVLGRPGVGLFRASRPEHSSRYESLEPILGPVERLCSQHCSWMHCRTLPCTQMKGITAEAVFDLVRRKVRSQRRPASA